MKLLLTGRGSRLPDLAAYLSETQQLEVIDFNPLEALSVGHTVDTALLKRYSSTLAEVVGEASRFKIQDRSPRQPGNHEDCAASKLTSSVQSSITFSNTPNIQLLPKSLANEMAFQKKRPYLIAATAALALATAPPILAYRQASQQEIVGAQALYLKVSEVESLHQQIVENEEQAQNLSHTIAQIETRLHSRSNWLIFFSELQEQLQQIQGVWLEGLSPNPSFENQLTLWGRLLIKEYDPSHPTSNAQVAAARVKNLLEGLKDSDFIDSITHITFNNTTPRILQFQFTLVTNPEKPL